MELHQESLRETHFEATATRFEFPWRIGRKSEMEQVGIPWGEPGRQGRSPGFTKLSQDHTETRRKLKVARGLVARLVQILGGRAGHQESAPKLPHQMGNVIFHSRFPHPAQGMWDVGYVGSDG